MSNTNLKRQHHFRHPQASTSPAGKTPETTNLHPGNCLTVKPTPLSGCPRGDHHIDGAVTQFLHQHFFFFFAVDSVLLFTAIVGFLELQLLETRHVYL